MNAPDPITLATVTSALTLLGHKVAEKAATDAAQSLWVRIKKVFGWQGSQHGCQSRPLRASRDASKQNTPPTTPSQICATSDSNPGRAASGQPRSGTNQPSPIRLHHPARSTLRRSLPALPTDPAAQWLDNRSGLPCPPRRMPRP